MMTRQLARNAASPSNILTFVLPEWHADACNDRELARQETQLREALAKVQALRRQRSAMLQPAKAGSCARCSPREKPRHVVSRR